VVVADLQGTITDLNEKMVQMYGFGDEAGNDDVLIGKNVFEFIASHDRIEAAQRMKQVVRDGNTGTGEFSLVRADGSELPAEISAGLLKDTHGNATGFVSIIRDISERKSMEEQLRRSENETRTITENVPALVSYVDADGKYRYANREYEKWFGIEPSAITGKHCREVLGEDTYCKIRKHVEAALGGRHVRYEDTLPYARGGPRCVMAEYLPDTEEGGKVRGFFALVTDITERKQAEQGLRKRVKELGCLYQIHRTMQETISVEALCEQVIQHLRSAMQYPEIAVAVIELGGKRFEDEHYRKGLLPSLFAEIGAEGETYGFVEVAYLEDKPFLLPEEQDLLSNVANAIGLWFADRRMREELMQSRSNLHKAQRIGHLGSWEWDVTNGTLTWSDELFHIFGVEKKDFELSHQGIEAMIHPDDRANNAEKVKQMLSGADSWSYGFRIVRPDGEIRHIHQTVEITCGCDGTAEKIFGTMQDVTERKRIEDKLSRRAVELQQLSKRLIHAREQERASIAKELHDELGQALTAVRINVSQLEKGLRKTVSSELRNRVQETGELADQLLGQVRDLALSLRPSMLDDLGLPSTLKWYTGRLAKRVGIEIDLEVEGEEKRLSEELRTVVYRVVQEALTNVARHAQASKVKIALTFAEADLSLSVKDNGKGFVVADMFSIESERPHIGLLSMRESVEELGGKLLIQSSLNRGTRTTIKIPIGKQT
jgi:two-component system sensor histidine kinase UhpB